jgi:pimeloyl-ACP methyl ester carboxylesterase
MILSYSDDGPGRAVVLLHGFPLSRAMWVEQIPDVGAMYRVIAPDLRGHGGSPAPEGVYTMDDMADDVIQTLDSLHISEPVVLGGLSMGGYVALSLVLRYPQRVRALMLMDTQAAADSIEAAATREVTAKSVLEAGAATPIVDPMIGRLFSPLTRERRPERVTPLREVIEQTTARGIAGALRGMAIRPDRRADLARISVPTLVLVGEDDVITPPAVARSLAEAIPGAHLEVIPEAGHMAPYENPSVVNAAILIFLRSLEGRH